MADSVDRVFTHALTTVRRLPRTGSSRPPPHDRLRLYGLYKQSMEGDVEGVMSRPTLPSSLSPPADNPDTELLRRQPSNQLLRTDSAGEIGGMSREEKEWRAEVEKYDAWKACEGMSRTEAKRKYISYLIETMKTYAVSTRESRELVSELDFVWEQVKQNTEALSRSGSGGSADSPPRGLRRGGETAEEDAGDGRERLRVLSPVSQTDRRAVIESEEVHRRHRERRDGGDENSGEGEEEDGEGQEDYTSASEEQQNPNSNSQHSNDNNNNNKPLDRRRPRPRNTPWRKTIESALQKMTAEMAALREQLQDSRAFPPSAESIYRRSRRGRLVRFWEWVRWLLWLVVKHVAVEVVILAVVVAWGKYRRDRRVEGMVRWVWGKWREGGRGLGVVG
ncbi:MAG: hypothetical protein Q9227_004648 [Pyrenula ochraceoflavens]